jgi:type II secretory pathway component GspD/PulD (secretin)
MITEPKLPLPEAMLANFIEGKSATEVEPADSNSANDEFFKRLLNSLADAEKRVAEEGQEAKEANEPSEIEFVPEADVPIEPTIEPTAPPVTDGIGVAELAAIVQRLEALEARLQARAKPSEAELTTVEIEEPAREVRYEPEAIPGGNDILKINLPPSVTLIEFLDYMAKNLGLTYIYDPAKVKGNVHIKFDGELAGEIKRKDLYPLLESVLQFNGFVMSRKGNLVTVVPEAEADKIDSVFVSDDAGKPEYGDVIVTRIFTLQHIDTATAKNLLTTMQLGLKDKIREVPEIGRLIVTGFAYRMPRIEELLQMIDQPGAPKEFRFKQLRFTMAQTLAPKVKTLVEQLAEDISISVSGAGRAAPPLARKPGESTAAFKRREAAAKRKAAAAGGAPTAAKAGKPSLYIDFDERTNRVMMIGYKSELDLVEKLIESLDVVQADLRTLRSYDIQNIDAEEVREKLSELGIVSGARTTTRRGAGTTKAPGAAKSGPKPTVTTTTPMAEGPLTEEPQVVIIESTNSLLVNATDEQHAQISMIVAYLDREAFETSIPYVVYPLQNQDPTKLEGVLNQLVKETIASKDAKGAKVETTTRKLDEDITIIAEPETYSLIVYASKKNQQWISSLVRKLDEYRPQVLLDVTLVEITKTDQFSIDLDLVTKLPELATGGSMEAPGLLGLLSPFPGRSVKELTVLSGDAHGFYADHHVQALLHMVHTKSYGRVLARPKLLVNDNQQGTISTTDTTYITRQETTFLQDQQGESTPIDKTIVEADDAGITLTINPHISKGDNLRLEITLTRSDFGQLTTDKPPDQSASDVTTVVTVPDNMTIILGGMEKLNQSKGGTKTPFFGDLPIVGGLFRGTSNADLQKRLYVFIKAHILRPGEETGESDVALVSAKNRATFERYEREMQEYHDIPGIKPAPMDPLRILDD